MLIGIYTDPHFSQYSNIVSSEDGYYTGRLENLIKSFEWANKVFEENKVDMIFCLGDLTDRNNLTAEEISAIDQCNLKDHYFIVGNHCRSDKHGFYNTLNMFKNVLYKPESIRLKDNTVLYILPYSNELIDLYDLDPSPDIILSHNDIADYDFGEYISKGGYLLNDILDNCKLFINGHLHRGEWLVKDRVMNLGSISGINFATLEGEWNPSIGIIDTKTLKVKLFENPHALKFRKKTIKTMLDLVEYISSLKGNNYIIQLKVPQNIILEVRNELNRERETNHIIASRIITYSDEAEHTKINKHASSNTSKSHYDILKEYIKEKKPDTYSLDTFNEIVDSLVNL